MQQRLRRHQDDEGVELGVGNEKGVSDPQPNRKSGERRKLPQQYPGAEPRLKTYMMHNRAVKRSSGKSC